MKLSKVISHDQLGPFAGLISLAVLPAATVTGAAFKDSFFLKESLSDVTRVVMFSAFYLYIVTKIFFSPSRS